MTKSSLTFGMSAAFVLCILPLAAEAGAAHSNYRPAQWQRSHDGQGVMRVYGGDVYRAPEAYTGGEFRGGLDVQTHREDARHEETRYEETRYADEEYYEASDRYVAAPAAGCRATCVTAYAPPPPPCVQVHREVRYAEPRVAAREVVIEEEESYESHSEYSRYDSRDGEYRRHHVRHDDCPCRQGHGHHREAEYHDRYDDHRSDDRYDDRDTGYRGDVFGRY